MVLNVQLNQGSFSLPRLYPMHDCTYLGIKSFPFWDWVSSKDTGIIGFIGGAASKLWFMALCVISELRFLSMISHDYIFICQQNYGLLGKTTKIFQSNFLLLDAKQVHRCFGSILTGFLTISLDNMKTCELMLGCIVHTKELSLAIPYQFIFHYVFFHYRIILRTLVR